jgi:hypothetical protein
VIERMLDLLLNEASAPPQDMNAIALSARKLLRPLANDAGRVDILSNHDRSIRCLKLCFLFLEEEYPNTGNPLRSKDVASAIRLSLVYSPTIVDTRIWKFLYQFGPRFELYWAGRPDWHTPAQFDLLVDYLLRACEGTDYATIGDTFVVLAALRGSPSTLERKRLYIETTTRLMALEVPLYTRHAAVSAALAIRRDIASLGREDESFRELFSQALNSVFWAPDSAVQQQVNTPLDEIPFNEWSIKDRNRNMGYLRLLCALLQEPTWHDQLYINGHFKSCLAIADTLSSRTGDFDGYAVNITHIFAIIDSLGEDHQILRAVQAYPSWSLVLRAWRFIFEFHFFLDETIEAWKELRSWDYVETLPLLVAYAMRYREQWALPAQGYSLIQLVKEVCDKLDEAKRQTGEQVVTPSEQEQENPFRYLGIPDLTMQIHGLLAYL